MWHCFDDRIMLMCGTVLMTEYVDVWHCFDDRIMLMCSTVLMTELC